MTTTVYLNGQFLPKEQARLSAEDRGFLFGDGIYEVVRTYEGRLFALKPHLDRMRYGLCELEINGVDVEQMGEVAAELVRRNQLTTGDATIYIEATRGAAPRTHFFPDPPVTPTVFAVASRFTPKADPARGIAAITVPDIRWARCDIKTVQLLPNVLANQKARAAGAQEALFVRDGVVLEGSHTSLFFVLEAQVRTAPKTNYILPSITRDIALELCREANISARETPVFTTQLERVSEVFLAGTTMEIMPIVTIDGTPVANGRPGPIATKLLQLFRERTRSDS